MAVRAASSYADPAIRFERLWLALSGALWLVAVLKAPQFPMIDSSLFEYFGRAMLHGARLYVDLIDNKPPSIYLVNMGWQALFGSHYLLHTLAEGLINLGSLVLFALTLRRAGIANWALGTLLFSAFFLIPYPQFNTTQHYAVFLIILGCYLHFGGADVWSGVAIALASTFWPGAALTSVPILLGPLPLRRRASYAGVFAGGLIAYVIATRLLVSATGTMGAAPSSGAPGPEHPSFMEMWPEYLRGSVAQLWDAGFNATHAAMIPGIVAMLFFLLAVARRPIGEVQRFGLIWSACMTLGALVPPNLSAHYLLPLTPALAFSIASFPSAPLRSLRAAAAIAGLIALAIAIRQTVVETAIVRSNAHFYEALGEWVRSAHGPGALVYAPDFSLEIQLAADGRYVADEAQGRTEVPDFIVAGPRSLRAMVDAPRRTEVQLGAGTFAYQPLCSGRGVVVYVREASASLFRCDPAIFE